MGGDFLSSENKLDFVCTVSANNSTQSAFSHKIWQLTATHGEADLPVSRECLRASPLTFEPRPRAAVYFVCRRGVDSLSAARLVAGYAVSAEAMPVGAASAREEPKCLSIRGGLRAWAEEVDASFPSY